VAADLLECADWARLVSGAARLEPRLAAAERSDKVRYGWLRVHSRRLFHQARHEVPIDVFPLQLRIPVPFSSQLLHSTQYVSHVHTPRTRPVFRMSEEGGCLGALAGIACVLRLEEVARVHQATAPDSAHYGHRDARRPRTRRLKWHLGETFQEDDGGISAIDVRRRRGDPKDVDDGCVLGARVSHLAIGSPAYIPSAHPVASVCSQEQRYATRERRDPAMRSGGARRATLNLPSC
jgi:hypothetical protein